jgi:hypothetical protein
MLRNRSALVIIQIFFCVWSLLIIALCVRGLIKYIRYGHSLGVYSVFTIPIVALSLEMISATSKRIRLNSLSIKFASSTSSIHFLPMTSMTTFLRGC